MGLMRSLLRAGLSLFLMLPLGCGKVSDFPLAPVKGRVLMNNSPLAKATVRFIPANPDNKRPAPPDSYGQTDEEGYFTLKPAANGFEGMEGAVVGHHQVQITKLDRSIPLELVPVRYNASSRLEKDVPAEGLKEEVFKLDSP
jgi:hypothetical protein